MAGAARGDRTDAAGDLDAEARAGTGSDADPDDAGTEATSSISPGP